MDWIPEPLRTIGPAGLAYWQWIGLVVTCLVSLVAGRIAAALFSVSARRLTSFTATTADDELIAKLRVPAVLLGATACIRIVLPLLRLPHDAREAVIDCLFGLLAIGLVWGALRVIDVVAMVLERAPWARARPSSRALLSLGKRVAKVIVAVVAVIGVLKTLGLPVGSLIAGLGIGGVAIAFGAQKTVGDLFGAFALGVDQPLREGDFVKIDADVVGTVEAVGLRSTRVRTLDRTVVSLPNGRVADMRIETYAERDQCRFTTTIHLVYTSTAAQVRQVLAGFERVLREHEKVDNDSVLVRFSQFSESSLDVDIVAMFQTGDWGQFLAYRQDVLLAFMDVVEAAGTEFAFPTHTVHLVGGPPPAAT